MTTATPDAELLAQHEVLPSHAAGGISNPVLGMLLFITSEIMFFAGLFAAYFTIRAGYTEVLNQQVVHVWPPTEFVGLLKVLPLIITDPATGTQKLNLILPATIVLVTSSFTCQMAVWAIRRDDHTAFRRGIAVTLVLGITDPATGTQKLNLILPATIILVTSSFTCQMAVWAIRRDDHVAFRRGIAVTLLLGITFLLMQAYDYTVLFSEGLSMSATPFGTTYFTLTGFHGAHVFGGALMLGVVLYRAMAGQFTSKHHDMVEATSLYWHFVDVVWIILFLTLYVL